jgi:hypothetical protein
MAVNRLEGPYHQSEIRDYLACPQVLLFKLQGVEPLFRPLAQLRGSAVHAAIHCLHAHQAPDRWAQVFEDAWCKEFSRPGPPVNAHPDRIEQEYAEWREAVGRYAAMEGAAPVLHSDKSLRPRVRRGRNH